MDMYIYRALCMVFMVLLSSSGFGLAGDIVHEDDVAPKRPGCDNKFVLVIGKP